MKEIVATLVEQEVKEIKKLFGDASYRAYYRVYLEDGSTRIVMQLPEGKSSVSEEITNFKGKHNELPYINVQRFLKGLGLPVPEIYRYDQQKRLMILEDLGDEILFNLVFSSDNKTKEEWYKKAIDLLIEIQKKSSTKKDECVALQRSFDDYLLNWEFDHFREYFIEDWCKKKLSLADRKLFDQETKNITSQILQMPYCFVHRDFQSRNLMVRNGLLNIIDFQDALLGPYVYDLVALLRDSYVELDSQIVEKLVKYYGANKPASFVSDDFKSFNLVTMQRKMKDCGRFVYIDRVKKNPNFLQYIPTTLRYIKNALEKGGKEELLDMLKKYVKEWE